MNDMRDCYDRLLSAAAATANSVYEFSESLKEMGDCLLEKTELNDDEESGKVLLMLGKVQFELQKLVDGYAKRSTQTKKKNYRLKTLCHNMDESKLKMKSDRCGAYMCKYTKPKFVEYWVPVGLSEMQIEQYCGTCS